MFGRNPDNRDIFDEGYKSLQKGILLFGGSLVALAILIFMFPALIGFIFAAFILFAGAAALGVPFEIRKLKSPPFNWAPAPGWTCGSVQAGLLHLPGW